MVPEDPWTINSRASLVELEIEYSSTTQTHHLSPQGLLGPEDEGQTKVGRDCWHLRDEKVDPAPPYQILGYQG